ncbi:14831_t:CDS:2, partial [Funneliformis geosporum]
NTSIIFGIIEAYLQPSDPNHLSNEEIFDDTLLQACPFVKIIGLFPTATYIPNDNSASTNDRIYSISIYEPNLESLLFPHLFPNARSNENRLETHDNNMPIDYQEGGGIIDDLELKRRLDRIKDTLSGTAQGGKQKLGLDKIDKYAIKLQQYQEMSDTNSVESLNTETSNVEPLSTETNNV